MTDRPDQPAPKRKRRRATTPPGHTATAPATVGQGAQVETVSAAAGPAKRRAPRKRAGKAAAAEAAAAELATAAETAPPAAQKGAASAKAPPAQAAQAGAATASPKHSPAHPPAHTPDADPGNVAGEPEHAVSEPTTEVAAVAEAVAHAEDVVEAEAIVPAAVTLAHASAASDEAAVSKNEQAAQGTAADASAFERSPIIAVADGADQAPTERLVSEQLVPDPHGLDRASADHPHSDESPAIGDQAGVPSANASGEQGSDAAPDAASDGSPEPRDADPPLPPPHDPHHRHGWVYAAMAVFALSLLFGAWGVWTTWLAGDEGDAQDVASLSGRIERLNQEVSTLRRSDQISRDANRDLQRTLAERDEEIAGLRADVAFYERFVGATGQRRGLSVHDLEMQLQSGEAWHFVATLTQNLNRGAVNTGRLTLSVEGTRNERMERLSWTQLRRQNNPPGAPYSFKYFQQVEGDVLLPKDFKPVRVIVRLTPAGGAAVEQSFTWNETQGRSPTP